MARGQARLRLRLVAITFGLLIGAHPAALATAFAAVILADATQLDGTLALPVILALIVWTRLCARILSSANTPRWQVRLATTLATGALLAWLFVFAAALASSA